MKPERLIISLYLIASLALSAAAEPSKSDSLITALQNCRGSAACLGVYLDACDFFLFADPTRAEEFCPEAMRRAIELSDTTALAKALNYNGILATIQARYLTGIEKFQEALTLYEIMQDDVGINKLLNNIGVIHSSLENFEEAIRFYSRSLQLNLKRNDHEGVAFNLHNLSSDYMQLKEYDLARLYADSLARYQALHGEFIKPFRLFGEWYLSQDSLEQAEHYLHRALDHMREVEEEHQLAGAYLSLAEVHRKRRDFGRAKHFSNRAEQTARRIGAADALVSVFEVISKIHRDEGAFEAAYQAQTVFITLKDSLDSVNNFNLINELNTRFETERKEKEIAEKEAMLIQSEATERMQVRIFSLIVSFVFVVLIMVSYSLMRKRRMNRILNQRNVEISEQRQKIIASINYAKKIQSAILLPEDNLRRFIPESFIFFRPKDIVSGDFYWFAKVDGRFMVASIDCTGHGVPGAFMSLIANSKLNKVVNEMGLRDPGDILNHVHREIIASLNQNEAFSDSQDGMDMTLCVFGHPGEPVRYAGAQNPVIIVNNSTVTEHKVDSLSIGGTFFSDAMSERGGFTTREIPYCSGASLYMFTDGFIDQFGGDENKKFNKPRFRDLLLRLSADGFTDAHTTLGTALQSWCGDQAQIDDILIIGLKLK